MYKRWLLIGVLLIALPAFAAEQAGIIKIAKGTAAWRSGADISNPTRHLLSIA